MLRCRFRGFARQGPLGRRRSSVPYPLRILQLVTFHALTVWALRDIFKKGEAYMEMNISGVSVRQLIAELPGLHRGDIEFLLPRPAHSAARFT